MRRGPEEDDEEQQQRLDRQRTGRRRPGHHRRQRAGGAADHDVLRGPALQPHGVDHRIEEDGEGEQRARHPVDQDAERHHREEGERDAEGERLSLRDASARDRPVGGARHQRVDIALIGHVERAGGPGADRDAQDRGEGEDRMDVARRDHEPDQRGEDHERHHPRLQQRDVVADLGLGNPGREIDGVVIDNRQVLSRFLLERSKPRAGRGLRI